MSKNFELLMEIEKDFNSAPLEPDRMQEPTSLSIPSSAVLNSSDGYDELTPLVERVFLTGIGNAHRRVVFCGIEAANPSSSVCARAARNLAVHTCERVCLVDANLSRADLTRLFGMPSSHNGNGTVVEECMPVSDNLWLTKCKWRNGGGERAVSDLRARMTELRQEFGYVLIDAPGCTVNDDATVLGRVSDAVILVIEAEATHRQAAAKAKQDLQTAGVHVVGTVLNNRSFPIPKAVYERL